ncbi:MAG TPA: hypothetical protein VMH82_00480 [Myxococcota bacterium]|nr:hypothetical protein [Myxococcota bacterium]
MSDPVAEALLAMDRRGFLRLAAATAVVASVGCRGRAIPDALAPPAGLELRVLSIRSYAAFQAAAMRLIGPVGAEATRSRRVDPAAAADAAVARLPELGATLQQGLWLLEFGVHPLVAKWLPFTALDPPEQDAVLENLMGSRWDVKRDLFQGLKSLAMLGYYADPGTWAALRAPGPFDREGIALAMRYELEPETEARSDPAG